MSLLHAHCDNVRRAMEQISLEVYILRVEVPHIVKSPPPQRKSCNGV